MGASPSKLWQVSSMSRLGKAFVSASLSLALFGLGRFLFNVLGLHVYGATVIGQLNVSISEWTLIAVIVATVPSVVASKFVSEYLVSSRQPQAARVLAACLCVTWGIYALAVVGVAAFSTDEVKQVWPIYGVAYASYMVLRGAYFAHQRVRDVLLSEVLGFCAFASLLGIGLVTKDASLAALSLVAQPSVYCLKALWDLRAAIQFNGALGELRSDLRGYGVFAGASLANAASGLASYHLSIVLAGHLVEQQADVGFLSVLLSTISPINLVPQALGSVLFAEFARRHGARDERGQRAVALQATVFLQIFALLLVGSLLTFPEVVFRGVGVPQSSELVGTWTWLVYVLGLTIVSSPCGHLLNATEHAPRQAIASLAFLGVGLIVGLWGMPRAGIVAAGWLRFGVDGGLAWTRMGIAQRVEPWIDRRMLDLMVFQLCFGVLFLLSFVAHPRWIGAPILGSGAIVLTVLARGELRRLYTSIGWQRVRSGRGGSR
jgi:O-antigen/teichoic acid export membrane protein